MTMSAPPAAAAGSAGDHVTFRVGGQWLGLPVATVQEVLVAQRLAPVPLGPAVVAGFLNLRGQIVTAVDLRTALGTSPRSAEQAEHYDVVVRDADELFALLVDEVGDVLPVEGVGPVPSTLTGAWRSACAGAVQRAHDVLLVLDLNRLLASPPRGDVTA